jgi:transcriptional regulator GlxA family with amidase domain
LSDPGQSPRRCVGAFVLAEAGLLHGRRATARWHRASDLQVRFPKAKWRKTEFSSSTARYGPRPG